MNTVLIVDDSDILRSLLHHALRSHFRILTAVDATEAYDLITAYKPDAVVLDVQMPGDMDGIALCEKIKSNHNLRHVYVMLATADADAALDNFAGPLHADDLVLKPYSTIDIIEKLTKAAAQK